MIIIINKLQFHGKRFCEKTVMGSKQKRMWPCANVDPLPQERVKGKD